MCENLTKENQRLVGELQSSTTLNILQAENVKIREQYQKLASDYQNGSEIHKQLRAQYQELAGIYSHLKDEREKILRERDTLQREVHILRNTRSLSADQQYALLEMKYKKVLELLKAQTTGMTHTINSPHFDSPMGSLHSMVRAVPFFHLNTIILTVDVRIILLSSLLSDGYQNPSCTASTLKYPTPLT